MYLRELRTPVSRIAGLGPKGTAKLLKLGVENMAQLLSLYPRSYQDRTRLVPLRDFNQGIVYTRARVVAHDWFGFGPMKHLKVHIDDGSAPAVLVCFNQDFYKNQLLVGSWYWIYGRFFYKYGEIQCSTFDPPEPAGEDSAGPPSGGLLPIYPLTKGLRQKTLRSAIKKALDLYGPSLEDELPEEIILRDGLLSKQKSLHSIHFPTHREDLSQARRTLIYEELFYLEMIVGKRALERREAPGRPLPPGGGRAKASGALQERLRSRLPFQLTPGQEGAIAEINADMEGPYPMARLIQGDVGSGKTLVCFFACLKAIAQGGQAALMAPTELLARQHADTAARLLEPLGIRVAFLTGNLKARNRRALLENLRAGEIDLAVGTHALFSQDVDYARLGLVVVDEQHRFGVTQRQAIMAKGGASPPDLLMMSATPIPRSLALTVFGDLDVSVIADMPRGRLPIKTHLASQANAQRVYDFVERELKAGRQAYFVYPLIDSSDSDSAALLKNAESMAETLQRRIFPRYSVALIHSRKDEEAKRETMEDFRLGKIQVLVATSVVEVGVDVPNATCMVIEHAERFGLAALHQLRGRVGRGTFQSYCFLVYSDEGGLTEDGKERLKVMLNSGDGFLIAEEDLKLRGPGQIAGIEQSGYLSLGLADPVRDAQELARAREDAFSILREDPALEKEGHRRITAILERAPPFTL